MGFLSDTSPGCHCRRLLILLIGMVFLTACSETQFLAHTAKRLSKYQKGHQSEIYKVGKPYQIQGVWYYPAEDYNYVETGIASWYGAKFHNKKTANGETYDMNKLTAAHRTLPLPSFVRVTNMENGRSLILRVNDRGPFVNNRIIDVSRRAAQLLGYKKQGTARVHIKIMANESRAIAARIKGKAVFAANGTPITVDRLPTIPVDNQPLPLPPGGKASGMAQSTSLTTSSPERVKKQRRGSYQKVKEPDLGLVTIQPVRPTNIFVQAGAYVRNENANRTSAYLSRLGKASISRILVNGRDLFRVRIGPFAEVAKADRILQWVIQAGFKDARIIID